MALNLSSGERQKDIKREGMPWHIDRELMWEAGNLVKWIKACRADKGQPRFVNFGNLLDKGKIIALCWGGYNKEGFANTATFVGVGEEDKRLLTDENKKDWVQLIQKYGSEQTKVEIFKKHDNTIDIRLKCNECCPECLNGN
jgi:hypothetical protein